MIFTKIYVKYSLILSSFTLILLLFSPLQANAQDGEEGQILLFEPFAPEPQQDEAQAKQFTFNAPSFERAKVEFLQNILAYYQIICDKRADFVFYDALNPVDNEQACRKLNQDVLAFLEKNEARIKNSVAILSRAATALTDEEKQVWAQFYHEKIYQNPTATCAQAILFECLHRFKKLDQSPMNFRFDRSLRLFHQLYLPLFDALLGNVD